jgi:hypothetical protein
MLMNSHFRPVTLTLCLALPAALFAGPRLDQIQVIGTHNSYHIAPHPSLMTLIRGRQPDAAESLEYTHRPLSDQFERLGIRQVELDLYADPAGGLFAEPTGLSIAVSRGLAAPPAPDPAAMRQPGTKILHAPDFDYQTTVATLGSALREIHQWSVDHPAHVPIFVLLELKEDAAGPDYTQPVPWTEPLLDALEQEILGMIPIGHIVRPDDVRGAQPTLRQAVQGHGWPALALLRGRIVFLLDDTDAVRDLYLVRNATLAQRLMFVSVDETHPAAAWFKINDPLAEFERIQSLVRQGFMVRTRADAGTREARRQEARRRDAAFTSGAQLISTDFPEPQPSWGAYHVRWENGVVARPNVVSLPGFETDLDLEELAVPGLEPFHIAELRLLNRRAAAFHLERRLKEASDDYARLLQLEPPALLSETQQRRILDLAPILRKVPGEPFRLVDVVALHHPRQPLIAYHLFWSDDIDFPSDNDPCDHEIVWVRYEPVSGRPVHQYSYFHGRILEAPVQTDQPLFAVEWGKHGSLPLDGSGNVPDAPALRRHWERLNREGIREPDHPLALHWPKRFADDWSAYRRYVESTDTRSVLSRRGFLWQSYWANAVLDQYALTYNFAAKTEWPE